MDGTQSGALGEIGRLIGLLREHGEVIEADITRFFHETRPPKALIVRRLYVLVEALIKMPESLLHKELAGDTWSLTDHLLALIHDQLAIANWQRSRDGQRGSNRPKPISPLAAKNQTRYGKTDRDPEEVKAFLRRLNPHQYA